MSIPYSALASVDDQQQQAPPQLAPPQPHGPAPQPQAQPQQGIGYMGQPSRLKAMLSSGASALLHFAGVASPEELQLKQQEMEIQHQHAQAAMVQAQGIAALRQAQSGELQPISPEMAASLGHPEWSGIPMKQAMMNLAKPTIAGQAQITKQGLANQGKIDAAKAQALIQSSKMSRLLPAQDEQGNQIYRMFNPFGQEIGTIDNAIVKELLPKISSTVDFKEDQFGQLVAIPKSTVTTPMLPGKKGAAAPAGGGSTGMASPVPGGGKPIMQTGKANKWVSWEEDGRTVAGPLAMAPRDSQPAEMGAQLVRDVQNARHTYQLMTKRGDPSTPETQGTLQLIDSLDKDGKLGVLASRYNKFLTTGVGSQPGDDPRIVTLLDKGMLATTGTMLSHFGASGGRSPQMLQHFEELKNEGKMDADTLRAGTKAIADYMGDRGMIPKAAGGSASTIRVKRLSDGLTGTINASDFDPKKYVKVTK